MNTQSSNGEIDPADALRAINAICSPDPRMLHFAVHEGDHARRYTLEDRHQTISEFALDHRTPLSVRIHFETAKNLYLYAWLVYRFHMVAEQYVCSTLEMALRERLFQANLLDPEAEWLPGLKGLLKIAKENKFLANERFTARDRWALRLARSRFSFEQMDRMRKEGLDSMQIDENEANPNADELNFDWLTHFIDHLPDQRNMHAHGTDSLYTNVLWTFEIVVELINQLFERP
jgi:hypothetical protein